MRASTHDSNLDWPKIVYSNKSLTFPITRRQNFRMVKIETNCRRHFKVRLK